jgi:hypothetical protein
MTDARQVDKASLYYRLSTKNSHAPDEIHPDAAAKAIANLPEHEPVEGVDETPLHMGAYKRKFDAGDATAPPPIAVERSWRVSEEEFIIKIDASPLHMSAARRMFDKDKDKDKKKAAAPEDTIPEEPTAEHQNEWGAFWDKMVTLYKSG